jgi:hypothetical protein
VNGRWRLPVLEAIVGVALSVVTNVFTGLFRAVAHVGRAVWRVITD